MPVSAKKCYKQILKALWGSTNGSSCMLVFGAKEWQLSQGIVFTYWLGQLKVGINVNVYAMVGEAVNGQGNCRCLCYGWNNDESGITPFGQTTVRRKTFGTIIFKTHFNKQTWRKYNFDVLFLFLFQIISLISGKFSLTHWFWLFMSILSLKVNQIVYFIVFKWLFLVKLCQKYLKWMTPQCQGVITWLDYHYYWKE